jgi:ankyrin repeat protein
MNPTHAILDAALHGDLAAVAALLNQDSSLANCALPEAYEGAPPLALAAAEGHLEVARALLDAGADPDRSGQDGTALMMAVWNNLPEVAQLLLSRGASANAPGPCGETPLHYAALKGRVELGELLLSHGATPDAHTTQGRTDMFNTSPPVVGETPLHLAAAYGHVGFVELLLTHKADKQAQDHCGQTPLHWAGRYQQEALLPLLR